MRAALTLIHMAAKSSSSAYLNGMHSPEMIAGQMIRFSIIRAALTKYIRHLDTVRCTHLASG